jgi:hypothetical protein
MEGKEREYFSLYILNNPAMMKIKFGVGAVGTEAASCYGSSSTNQVWLVAALRLRHPQC